MQHTYYQICGLTVEIISPLRPADTQTTFRIAPAPADLIVTLEPRQALSLPDAQFLGHSRDRTIWRQEQRIIRHNQDFFRPQAHMTTSYALDDWQHVTALVRQEDWPWATDSRYLWTGLALNQLLIHADCLLFHASYICWNGQGILFTAPSQTGKSTQANLWHQYRGAEVINGDKAAVRLGAIPMVHSIPFSGTSGICSNRSCPLEAVVVLSQAHENTVRHMKPTEIIQALIPNIFVEQAVGEEWSLALRLVLDLAASIPVWHLACTPDERAVRALQNALEKK